MSQVEESIGCQNKECSRKVRNKSGLRKSEKVNWQIKNEKKDARTIQHPVKLL